MSGGPSLPPDAGEPTLGEREARAAEYVLGTLPPDERAAVAVARATDPALDADIRAWEARLDPLSREVPEVDPPERVWAGVERRLRAETAAAASGPDDRLAVLARQVRRWRFATAGAGALAAGLALALVLPRPVEVPGRYVAVVSANGEVPALIVSVDTASGMARVRPVGARAPAGRSLELWYVGEGRPPRSLGPVGDGPGRIGLPGEAGKGASVGEGAFAVSVEPPGGSPTGRPTGPVIYQGRLIRE